MNEPPNLHTFHGDPAAPVAISPATPRRTQAPFERPGRLAQTLSEARWNSGLELDDLAEITHIRSFHLEALEAGRLSELPSDAQGKNLVRRYAQAVGLDPARALILYAQERRSLPTHNVVRLELPSDDTGTRWEAPPRFGRFARLLGSLLLVAGAIWFALRVFDSTLNPATAGAGAVQPLQAAAEPTPALVETASSAPAMILLSLQTTPPGAEISIDGYRFGQSPIIDAPVRAGNRTIKVTRGGYGTFESTLDLGRDRRLDVTLLPKGAGEPTVTGAAPAQAQTPALAGSVSAPAASASAGQIVVRVSAEAWLEVYRGSARGGERLVYETAEPGATYSFRAPIYIFSGNAGGVSVAVAAGDVQTKPLGVLGAVVGQAY